MDQDIWNSMCLPSWAIPVYVQEHGSPYPVVLPQLFTWPAREDITGSEFYCFVSDCWWDRVFAVESWPHCKSLPPPSGRYNVKITCPNWLFEIFTCTGQALMSSPDVILQYQWAKYKMFCTDKYVPYLTGCNLSRFYCHNSLSISSFATINIWQK